MGRETANPAEVSTAEAVLRPVLRLIGTASLFATVFVVVPRSVMERIHAAIGLGTLPEAPILDYLARSTSALYAILGGVFWVVSFDLPRYRSLLTWLGAAIACFGVALLVVDATAGLPRMWTLWEGPFVAALGLTILVLGRRIPEGRS